MVTAAAPAAPLKQPDAPCPGTDRPDLGRREMYAEIKRLCAPDNYTNAFVLLGEYLFFALTVAACMWAYHLVLVAGWSLWWMTPVYLVTVFVIGVWTQNRLGVLLHEGSHYLLFKNRVLNDVITNLFVAFPLFGAIHNYRIGHWSHHRHVNDPDRDPDLKRLIKHHPREFPIGKWRFLWEYILLQVSPHKAASYLKGRAEYVMFTRRDEAVKNEDALGRPLFVTMRRSYYLALIVLLTWLGLWPHFFLFWLVPMFTFYPAVLFLREIAHHGNYPDNGDFTLSRVYEGKWLEREIFFPFGERNHVLHHMFPTIPWHNVMAAHGVMMQYPPYRENVVLCDGFFFKGDRNSNDPTVLDVLAHSSRTYLHKAHGEEPADEIRRSTVDEVGAVEVRKAAWHGGES